MFLSFLESLLLFSVRGLKIWKASSFFAASSSQSTGMFLSFMWNALGESANFLPMVFFFFHFFSEGEAGELFAFSLKHSIVLHRKEVWKDCTGSAKYNTCSLKKPPPLDLWQLGSLHCANHTHKSLPADLVNQARHILGSAPPPPPPPPKSVSLW